VGPTSPLPFLLPDRPVALGAVDRPAVPGLERHLGISATASANRRVHFSLWSATSIVEVAFVPSGLAHSTAFWAPRGIVGEALLSEELLLANSEDELAAAVSANDGFVCQWHYAAPKMELIHFDNLYTTAEDNSPFNSTSRDPDVMAVPDCLHCLLEALKRDARTAGRGTPHAAPDPRPPVQPMCSPPPWTAGRTGPEAPPSPSSGGGGSPQGLPLPAADSWRDRSFLRRGPPRWRLPRNTSDHIPRSLLLHMVRPRSEVSNMVDIVDAPSSPARPRLRMSTVAGLSLEATWAPRRRFTGTKF